MKPSEELREQREAILRGMWVQTVPSLENEACLAMRTNWSGFLSCPAQRVLGLALVQLSWDVEWISSLSGVFPDITLVNDHQFTSPNDAIEALELAERIAKEAGL